jgi:alkanesulfonate monooxygenase SsuD/methylene tetrahydromethanopterin reductase-like flavin-dependent oxidoreductase (luciferase family)
MRLGVSLALDPSAPVSGAAFNAGMATAERVGFQSLWFFDSIGRGKFRPDPITAMAAAAAVTSEVEIGSCILQVPLRHPVELAHRVLGLHYLSGNRLLLGIGAGSTKIDFDAVEGDYETRFRQLTEAIPLMQALWRGEVVRDVDLTPPPGQRGGPPILIGSWAGSRWIPIAAKQHSGWIASAHFTNYQTLKEGVERYQGEGGKRAVATNIPVDLTATSASLGEEDHLDLRCGPEEAASRLQRLADAGFDDAVVTVTNFSEAHMAQVRALFPAQG